MVYGDLRMDFSDRLFTPVYPQRENWEVTDGLVVILERASQWHELYCYDLEVMSSNPGRVELGVRGTSVLSRT